MSDFFRQILGLLTAPPGNLIFHLVLVFSVASALQSAFLHWRASGFPQARRAMLGLAMLLLAQVFIFIFSGLGWRGQIDPLASLPPMDRAITLFSIIWITWLWAFPEPSRTADAAAVLASLLVVTAMALSLLTWPAQSSQTSYNETFDNRLWQLNSLIFVALGLLLLALRRPNGYWNGVTVLAVAFLGHAGHLLFPEPGNYSGVVRLAYMAAYPILLTLPQRFPLPTTTLARPPAARQDSKADARQGAKQDAPVRERRRYSTDPKTFHALLALAAESDATRISQAITRAVSQAMLADLCFLIYLTDDKQQLTIAGGYDLIREDHLEGGTLNKAAIPMLSNAIQRGRALRLPASGTSADIKGLGDILGLSSPGHILCVPIKTPDKDQLGAVMLLSPYSDRAWTADDQGFLANIAHSLVPIIQRGQKAKGLDQQGDQMRSRVADLELRNLELTQQMETVRREAESRGDRSQELTSLLASQQDLQGVVAHLEQENADLRARAKSAKAAPASAQLEQELKNALQDAARLQNQLAESNQRALELEKGQITTKSVDQAEVIASISQELRQPMSSIVGYTDLLLGESVGILGALQRKFIERIKASTERIGSLIEDMIQLTTLESGLVDLRPEAVDLNSIIDNAMSYTSSQVREKNISMHLNLPKKVAPIHADREALQQILIHLLQNAGAATPVEGSITLAVQTRKEADEDYVVVQVTDGGGGIPSEDLPRVFTRLYRADNVLIQGVGDTGVGLSIAKTLTEAQRGRIWVESEPGVGSTFSVLLPIASENGGKPSKTKAKKK